MDFVIRYSPGARAAYIHIGGDHRLSYRTIEVGQDEEVMADLDENGQVVGIELLDVSEPVVHVLYDDDGDRPKQTLRTVNDLL